MPASRSQAIFCENATPEFAHGASAEGPIEFYQEVERYEMELIQQAFEQAFGNQKRAAQLLGFKPTTLNAKIKHLGVYPVELSAQHSVQNDQISFPQKRIRNARGTAALASVLRIREEWIRLRFLLFCYRGFGLKIKFSDESHPNCKQAN